MCLKTWHKSKKYYQYKIKEDDIDLKFIANIIYDYLDKSKLDDLRYILNTVELKTKELMEEHNDSVVPRTSANFSFDKLYCFL